MSEDYINSWIERNRKRTVQSGSVERTIYDSSNYTFQRKKYNILKEEGGKVLSKCVNKRDLGVNQYFAENILFPTDKKKSWEEFENG